MAGRFRRLILRPFAWGLAVAVLAVLGTVLLLRSQFLQRRAGALIETRVGEAFGRQLSIGRVRLGFFPISLDAWDVTLAGPRAEDPPAGTVEHVRIEADWFGWRRPVIAVRTVLVENPRIRFVYDAEGRDNWPRLRRRAPPGSIPRAVGPRRFSVRIEHLRVAGGEFLLEDRRWPVDIDARGVEGIALGVEDLRLRGHASVDDIVLTLPNALPVRASLASDVEIARGEVLLSAAAMSAPNLEVRGDGVIRWGRTRSVDLQLVASGSTELLESMGYLKAEDPVVRGPFDLQGTFAWAPQKWGYQGTLKAPELLVLDRRFENVAGPFVGDREGVRVDFERASHHGGAVTGFLAVDLLGKDYPAEVKLEFQGADAADLLLDQSVPVSAIAATADGTFDYRFSFRGGGAGEGQVRARLTPLPPSADDPRLAVAGDVAVDLSNGMVRVLPATILGERAGGRTTITVGGSYLIAEDTGHFDIGVETERLGDLRPFLSAPGAGEATSAVSAASAASADVLWLPSRGRGRLDIGLDLAPAGPSASVELELQDVVTPGLTASTARGRLRVDENWVEDLDLELASSDGSGATARLSGQIPQRETPVSPLPGAMEIRVEATGWPLADARPWLPEDLMEAPVDGRFHGELQLRGDPENPSGELTGRLEQAAWTGLVLGTLRFEVGLSPVAVALRSVRLEMPAGTVAASGAIGLTPASGSAGPAGAAGLNIVFSGPLRLDAPPFALRDPGAGPKGPEGLAGLAFLEGRITGTSERPTLESTVELSELTLAGRPIRGAVGPSGGGSSGTGSIRATWKDLRFDARAEIPGLLDVSGGGPLAWQGAGTAEHLEADWDLAVRLGDLGALTAVVAPGFDGLGGTLAGRLTARGPLDDLALGVVVSDLAVNYLDHTLAALEPIRGSFDGRFLILDSIYVGEPATSDEVFVAGRVDLGEDDGPGTLDLRFQATVSADWAKPFLPPAEVAGTVDALGAVRGTLRDPAISGQATLREGRFLFADFPQVLEDVEVTLLADPREVVIDQASLLTGGGSLRASGSVTLPRATSTGDSQALDYRVQVQVRDVTMRYPEGFWMRGGGELSLVSVPAGRQVRGFVELDQIAYVRDIDLSLPQLMRTFLAKQRVEVREADEFLSTTQLNVAVQAPGTFRVSNNLARLRGTADLTVRGTLATPVLFGRLEIDPGGTLVYGENDYTIEQARVTFVNPFRIEPLIDLKARTRINPYEVTLSLSGTPERLDARFTSDPPIPDIDILTLIATGGSGDPGLGNGPLTPTTNPNALPGQATGIGAETFLAGQAANFVGERVNQLFQFDRFRVAPLVGSEQNISSVRVTVGKRLSRNVYVTYSVDPSQSRDQLLAVEWRVAANLSLVFIQNGSGSYAVDARWETAF